MTELRPPPACPAAGDLACGPGGLAVARAMVTSGGDERLLIDPRTGRNRYGVSLAPPAGEVWFASSTASPASPRGLGAAAAKLAAVLAPRARATAGDWSDGLRARILRLFPCPGAEVILAPSGTDAELIVLALARGIVGLPLTNVVMAPCETGRGVGLAASGRHFLGSSASGVDVTPGARLAGLEDADIAVTGIAIRHPDGAPMSDDAVDAAALAAAGAAMAVGRGVLLHCLDASKTGLQGLRRATASRFAAAAPGRALVVVDACQLRCPPEQVSRDLAAGFIVVITGSKYAGGPAFSGAVLVPPHLADALGTLSLPEGLGAHMALDDWPARRRSRIDGSFRLRSNLGLYARWEAALSEIERYLAVEPALRDDVVARFAARVTAALAGTPGCRLAAGEPPGGLGRTIFPVLTTRRDGSELPADILQAGLMAPQPRGAGDGSGRTFHVGQPVEIGRRSALRLCLGAVQVSEVADRVARGLDRDRAFEPLGRDVDDVLAKWGRLRDRAA